MFLLPTPSAYEKSQLCAKRLCVCVYWGGGEGIRFLSVYFPVESLPCSQGSSVFTVYEFG